MLSPVLSLLDVLPCPTMNHQQALSILDAIYFTLSGHQIPQMQPSLHPQPSFLLTSSFIRTRRLDQAEDISLETLSEAIWSLGSSSDRSSLEQFFDSVFSFLVGAYAPSSPLRVPTNLSQRGENQKTPPIFANPVPSLLFETYLAQLKQSATARFNMVQSAQLEIVNMVVSAAHYAYSRPTQSGGQFDATWVLGALFSSITYLLEQVRRLLDQSRWQEDLGGPEAGQAIYCVLFQG